MKRKHDQQRSKGKRKSNSKAKPRPLHYSSLTAQAKAEYGRAIDLLYDLRHSGGTYTQLLRRHRLSTWKAHKYLGANLLTGKRGTRVQASKSDRLIRILLFPRPWGDVLEPIRGSAAATKLSKYYLDRAELQGGDITIEAFEFKWRDVRIDGREVFADAAAILHMADAGIFNVQDLYSSVGPER